MQSCAWASRPLNAYTNLDLIDYDFRVLSPELLLSTPASSVYIPYPNCRATSDRWWGLSGVIANRNSLLNSPAQGAQMPFARTSVHPILDVKGERAPLLVSHHWLREAPVSCSALGGLAWMNSRTALAYDL